MIALEVSVLCGSLAFIAWAVWFVFKPDIISHQRLFVGLAAAFVAISVIGFFVASLLYGGVSFTGANLHPPPPPVPTDLPTF